MTRLGKFEILSSLGSGATAEVYRAHDTVLGRDVALKVLKPALVADSTAFERFVQEARAAAVLFHPHIATVLDMGESDGRYFIAMRYYPGSSLDRIIKEQGPLSWEEALRMVEQVGSAFDYAHGEGFLHRDVKPSNILRTPQGEYILTDFGLTRAMMSTGLTSHTGAVLGTPAYIAPEVWEGKPAVPATDQYALACVLVEALTSYQPFNAPSPPAIMARHFRPIELPQDWPIKAPDDFESIIRRALSQEPPERFDSIGKFTKVMKIKPSTGVFLHTDEEGGMDNHFQLDIEEISEFKEKNDRHESSKDQIIRTEGTFSGPLEQLKETESEQKKVIATYQTPNDHVRKVGVVVTFVLLVCCGLLSWLIVNNTHFRLFEPSIPSEKTPTDTIIIELPPTPTNHIVLIPSATYTLQTSLTVNKPSATVKPTRTSNPLNPPGNPSKGDLWSFPKDGMKLVYISPGDFLMGSDESDPNALPDEKPQKTIYVDGFWIDTTEVTNEMFAKFVEITHYLTDAENPNSSKQWNLTSGGQAVWSSSSKDNWKSPKGAASNIDSLEHYPVVQISWNDAKSYCEWAGRRLPTEAEWEKAARGTDGRIYPWGNEPTDANRLNHLNRVGKITEVGSYPDGKSIYGLFDMAGNVNEWVADNNEDSIIKILRGGSFLDKSIHVRAAYRYTIFNIFRNIDTGFRCALSRTGE